MMIQPTDKDINDILVRPYEYLKFEPEEIMRRLQMLTPERCIAMLVSQIVEQQC